MNYKKLLSLVLFVFALGIMPYADAMTIAGKTKGMASQSGFFTIYWDENNGQLYLEIEKPGQEFIYNTGLPGGLGSNDIGLDRRQIGDSLLVRFERLGDKVFLRQLNLAYRANSDNEKERQAVTDAFASSIIGGFKVEAQDKGRILINMTDFLLTDQHGIADRIAGAKQGSFTVDKSRSAVYMPRTKNFPENTEFEAVLTLKSQNPGQYVKEVSPQGKVISLRQHISFVKLPEPGYKNRGYHVNSGYFPDGYVDYAVPIEENIQRRYINRHRLEKKDPKAAVSEAKEPIIYYLDPGVPEPIRGALLDGAGWWNEAFEAAGYKNAFQVKMLPEDADPMDVRYNIINWVHRKTRGWSYGWRVADPRTGEILKGHVTLGSLRVRQDFLIATALLSPYKSADADVSALKEMALARIRQLAAHEVGHTLGLAHNFTPSSVGRKSVMDYPHPLIKINANETLDISDAYDVGIGDWDKYAIRYGYGEFDQEAQALQTVMDEARDAGLKFMSDPDSRRASDFHSGSHLWDNGADPVDELERLYRVRKIALKGFSEKAIRHGEPLSSLEEVLVPLYYLHRYQLEAVGKAIGGLDYDYRVRTNKAEDAYHIITDSEQKRSLDSMLKSVTADVLNLPERIMKLIPPTPYGHNRSRESFPHYTGSAFDGLALSEAAAGHVMSILLHPERASRIFQQHARDGSNIGLIDYIDHITDKVIKSKRELHMKGAIQRRVGHVLVHYLMLLQQEKKASPAVKSVAHVKLVGLEKWFRKQANKSSDGMLYKSHYLYQADRIVNFMEGRLKVSPSDIKAMPPGSPI